MGAIEYNPSKILVSWGEVVLGGYAADDIVTIAFDEDAVTKTVGSQGEVVWTVNQNRGGSAKIQTLQGSPINAALSAACASVGDRKRGLIIKPFQVTDLNGTAFALGPKAIVKKMPDIARSKAHKPVEWMFDIAEWTKISNGGISFPGPGGSVISTVTGILGAL